MSQEITLHRTVTVPDDTDEAQVRMYKQFADIYGDLFDTFIFKNMDYGSSFVTGGVKDVIKGKYDDPVTANIDNIQVRLSDKDDRIDEQVMGGGENLVSESVFETAGDAANYRIMQAWLAEYGDEMIRELADIERRDAMANPEFLNRHLIEGGVKEEIRREVVDEKFGTGTYKHEVEA